MIMLIRELKEKLNQYPDNYAIEMLDEDCNDYTILDIDKSINYDDCVTLFIK